MKRSNLRCASICKAIQILSTRCDNVFIPVCTGEYDLIVDAKGVISRIKVLRTEGDIVALRKGTNKALFRSTSCEFIFADSPGGQYLIPANEINQTTAVMLSHFEKYLIKNKG